MGRIKCRVSECDQFFETAEALHPEARFICRHHKRRVQVLTNDRQYNPDTDHGDETAHFQDVAFDPKLGVRPQKKAKRAVSEPLPWPTTLRN